MTYTLTDEQYTDLEQAAVVYPNVWMHDHCKIESKNQGLVSLVCNVAQMQVLRIIYERRKLGKPVKIIVLKARQQGISTFGLAYQYYRTWLHPNHRALMAAHDGDSTKLLFDRVRLMHHHDPQPRRQKLSNRREIQYQPPHSSTIWVATAGDSELGRSQTVQDLHISELAFWPDPASAMLAVMQCVPPTNPDTTVIIESTANGVGGEFYNRWCQATVWESSPWMTMPQGTDPEGFIALFLPWHTFPEYCDPVPAGFHMADEERELVDRFRLSPGQLVWRRRMIRDYCGGDIDKFRQEYPATDQEAFLVSGRPRFDARALTAMAGRCKPPVMRGELIEIRGELKFHEEPRGRIEVWQPPKGVLRYGIGADTAEGLDPNDRKDPDFNSAHVGCLETRAVVAKVSDRYDPDLFAADLDKLGRWYHTALLGFEVNNTSGGSVRSSLRRLRYPNLYYRETWDEDADKYTRKLGWYTDKLTRGTLIADGATAIRQGEFAVYSAQTVQQLLSFVVDKTGKAAAMTGTHDDDVMSLLIMWQMLQALAAMGDTAVPEITTGEALTPTQGIAAGDMVIGGVEGENDDEYWGPEREEVEYW